MKQNWWERKLFQPRSIEGKPLKEQFDYIRELFDLTLKQDSRLKGITIIGSTLKGYATNMSDIDIAVIVDNSSPIISKSGHEVYGFNAVYDAQDHLDEKRKKAGLPIFKVEEHIRIDINNLTPEQIKRLDDAGLGSDIQGLIFPGVGDIETYRKIVREEINKFSKEDKEQWLKRLTNLAIERLDFNSTRPLARGMITGDENLDFLESKKKLINTRVRRIFG